MAPMLVAETSREDSAPPGETPAPADVLATCERLIEERIPNFLRIAPSPSVTQTCWSLSRCVREAWPGTAERIPGSQQQPALGDCSIFLCNSAEEALSGAIKLARFTQHAASPNAAGSGVIVDPDNEWEDFAASQLAGGSQVEYLPGFARSGLDAIDLLEVDSPDRAVREAPGILILSSAALRGLTARGVEELQSRMTGGDCLLIVCAEPSLLAEIRGQESNILRKLVPDIVVFGDAFTRRQVPFGAFAARSDFHAPWMSRNLSQFHSTTFQPNAVSTLHFMESLRASDPDFVREHAGELRRLRVDPTECLAVAARLYSPQLARLARRVGAHRQPVTAAGHYFELRGRKVFDGVAGVACSIRGHNPPRYVDEIRELEASLTPDECRAETAERLAGLTGLPHHVPAVSGAAAVEQALKLGLCAQFPRKHILALRGGFGGKTLLALTGTSKAFYKQGLDPLYPSVSYVDPFAADAIPQIESVLREHDVAIVMLELIQGVGGVRAIPPAVLRFLNEQRAQAGYLLFTDEIQTGMFRTGPFVRSRAVGLEPDLLTIGKGASDMMFPFGCTLYSERVAEALDRTLRGSRGGVSLDMREQWHSRYGYPTGYLTLLNTLRRAETSGLTERVAAAGERLTAGLRREVSGCRRVADVRTFGLLAGIELDLTRGPERWLGKTAPQLVLLRMLQHPTFPLLMGFCQYEPHVLKFTPPLSVTDDEIDRLCVSIGETLRGSFTRLFTAAIASFFQERLGRTRTSRETVR